MPLSFPRQPLILMCFLGSLMSTTPSPAEPWLSNYRLSPHLIPKLYEVKLEPDLKGSASFTCEEKILVQVTAPVDYIYVHIDRLNVTKSVVMQHNVQVRAHQRSLRSTYTYTVDCSGRAI